jgi:diguanylate cyclase (GGDEF)-like protein/PAS domain S-box-containing protein
MVASTQTPRDLPQLVRALARERRERKRVEGTLAHQATHDALTGLPNRQVLFDRVELAILSASRRSEPLALLVLDLDHFKEINGTLGHHTGDRLLQQVALRLSEVVGARDLVARLGGDEFAILLPDTTIRRAQRVAGKLIAALERGVTLDDRRIDVSASVGIARYPEHGEDATSLLRRADVAMYSAKGTDAGFASYSVDTDGNDPDKLALLGELRVAIESGQLLLHYQPKLDLHDGTLVGVEALVRWQHPRHGFLPPSEFISLAEHKGLIYPLTCWVLDAALRQHQAWREMGLDICVAVNLSRRVLQYPELPDMVSRLLARWDAAPDALVLEITESSLMADLSGVRENLGKLRALGVRMSIDDFGTGYSSLASLKNLSVDELKIDASFVKAMATDAVARAIVCAIIELADALRLLVVAEGVEDQATWDVLAGLGCQVAQGYFLSPPIAADELKTWVTEVSPLWLDTAARSRVKDALDERSGLRGARLTAEEEFLARTRAEAALRASEERNRLALQAAGMGTWDRDVVRNVLTWSSETEALHGLAPGTFDQTTAGFRRAVDPRDWPALEMELQSAKAQRRETFATYRTIWPDGSVHWIETKGRALYGDAGTLLRITGTSMDITERKQAEESLRANEERFRRQYKSFPLPTYSWLQVGDDFVLQDFNDAAEIATEGHILEGLGRAASEMYAEQPEIMADFRRCVTQQHTLRREMRYRYRRTGLERDLAVTYAFVPPHTVMAHIEDLTDVKRAEQQRQAMAQSEKLRALGQMASGIAHDLNQSLMLVASYTDLARQALMEDPPNLVEIDDLLSTTTRAAIDGGDTVKRLLLFTRTAPEQDNERVDLSTVVRDAAQLTAPRWRDAAQAAGRPIGLHVDVEGHPTVRGSPGRLRELMTNLIFNAVDALPTGGAIGLRVLAEDDQGIIEVVDSGVGMSTEVQERVFEPFFTTKGDAGTGLGLAMVFRIVEQHCGHIQLRSAPGLGTTFRIALPLVSATTQAEPRPAPPAPLAPSLPLRVLVVDDEPLMSRAVVRMLKPSGHAVSIAASGAQALEMLAGKTFDVVVSDMAMGPGMNGWDLAGAVKTRWPNVRFLLATGWGAAIDPAEAAAKGVETVLSKPYHRVQLLQALVPPHLG